MSEPLTSNEQLAQALRNLRDVAHREVSPRYSAALDEAFTLADIALGEFDSEGDVSREADVGPGGGVRATHATGSAPSKPGAAEPPTADLLGALRDARRYVEAYEPRDVSEAHDRDLMLNSIDALAPSTKTVRNEACLGDGVPCASDGAGGCVACDDGKGNYRPAVETTAALFDVKCARCGKPGKISRQVDVYYCDIICAD